MTPTEALEILNKTKQVDEHFKKMLDKWQWTYYGMSLHTLGVCPWFYSMRDGFALTSRYYPHGWVSEHYQILFDEHIFSRHPSESPITRNWRYANYRPFTRTAFMLLSEVVTGALFHDSQYELTIENEDDNAYIWGNNFSGNDIAAYFENIGYRNMIDDPNGYFVRIPKYSAANQPPNAKLEVDIWFVKTIDIISLSKEAILFKRDRQAYLIDKTTIYQFEIKENETYVPTTNWVYYVHNLGRLPITVAGGEWNTYGYFESWYCKGKPVADDFASTYSAAQLVDKEASHPVILEPDTMCGECQGAGFRYEDVIGYDVKQNIQCGKCKGTGSIRRNPGERGLMSEKDFLNKATVEFINPDVAINKHHRETVKTLQFALMDALSLTKTEEAQSGVAKAIDQERLYRFISKISNRLFDIIIYDTLNDIIQYRNVQSTPNGLAPARGKFVIIKPKQFSIETADDIIDRYNKAKEAELPLYARTEMMRSWVDKEYSGNTFLKKKSNFILYSDPFAVATLSELTGLKATDEEIRYHLMLPKWLEIIIMDKGNKWFTDSTFETIQAEVDKIKN